MDGTLIDLAGTPVYLLDAEGDLLDSGYQTAVDLIGHAYEADWVAIPATRLDAAFFDLSTRLLGEWAQKFTQYSVGMAIVGDLSAHTETSSALAAFVHESNRGRHLRFAHDLDEFAASLGSKTR